MRYALLIVLGLAIGIIGTVMTMNALNRGPHIPQSLMHMNDFHMDGLHGNIEQNHCAVTDNLPHLQALRVLSNDIEPAFLPIDHEDVFKQKASNMRATLDALLAAPPSDCAAVGAAMTKIGHDCKSCHQEFRN